MNPSLQKLHKFLKLEAEHGYDNRAVIGGLDKMLTHWEGEARAESVPDEMINAVVARLRDYPRLTPASRADAIEGIWRRIQRETGETLPPLPPPPSARGMADLAENESPSPERAAVPRPPKPRPEPPRPAFPPREEPARREVTPPAPIPQPVRKPTPPPEGPVAALNAPVTVLHGVGPKHGETLGRLNLRTLGDLFYYFPRRYDDYTQLKPINRLWYGEEVTVIGMVQSISTRPLRGGRQMVEAVIQDGTGALRATWFNPYVAKRVRGGMQVVLSGKVEQYLGRLAMNNPEVEPLEQENLHTNRIVPVYPLTANITQRWLRKLMHEVVSYWAPRLPDPLPEAVRTAAGLTDLPAALLQAHFPTSWEALKAARYRLAFDEIFLLQLGVLRQKRQWQDRAARAFDAPSDWLDGQIARLPYALTGAQRRSLADLRTDLASSRPMNRLIQGDVGSGKTVVAALAMSIVTHTGAQAALMAPTSILAEQHYKNLTQLLTQTQTARPTTATPETVALETAAPELVAPETAASETTVDAAPLNDAVIGEPPLRPEQIRLMVGATPEAEKSEIRAGLASGEIKIIIGTHALIEDPVTFADLELVVVDEQHRFGVEQRALLRAKGQNPHLLVMTATPIPRSLALTVYGDLDLSVMDEMPPGRQPIETQVFYPRERERVYSLVRAQVEQGRQVFIIYPLVEESENSTLAAVEEHARLQRDIFPKYRLGLLHGRLKPEEKDTVMGEFRDGQTQILVSTSVVEVGVDVPNATLMIIEGANRFGLAQLHQFRGRVGRGAAQSYCALIPETPDDAENARLMAMAETNDGFVLAEHDLEQRGPGDFLGTRQAGFSELRMASLTDVKLIEAARNQAQAVFAADPDLAQPEYQLLTAALRRFWREGQGDIS